ncbi:legume-like lectin family protein [Cadophora sp. DSE1049]|nr:legume-like lectin family protein [Cadophora sp. DSE1049]
MHFTAPLSSLASASAFFFAYAQASYLHNDLSFGHQDRISPNLRAIPNWHLIGKPDPPEILSNKLVLTPPAPGNQRAAIWSEKQLQHQYWTVDVDFRATGPERAGGNMQMWYVKDGKNVVGTSSIYTVGKFDGLVLVIDQYAGSAGYIRAFLNDGSTDYKSHHSIDSLAFGHCEYAFRNLGRPSRVAIQQSSTGFKVSVDGHLCFESNKVKLPLGNNFGLTAASAENPDSFEVFKFVTTTESHTPDILDPAQGNVGSQQILNSDVHGRAEDKPRGDIPSYSDPVDEAASKYTSSSEQFADLHNRLQSMMKHISATSRDQAHWQTQAQKTSELLAERLARIEASLGELHSLRERIDAIQADVRQTKSDLHNQLDRHVANIQGEVRDTHSSLTGRIEKGSGIGRFVVVVVGSQVVLVGAYLLYKRRRAGSHMKYL